MTTPGTTTSPIPAPAAPAMPTSWSPPPAAAPTYSPAPAPAMPGYGYGPPPAPAPQMMPPGATPVGNGMYLMPATSAPAPAPAAPAPAADPYATFYADLAQRAGSSPDRIKAVFDQHGGPAEYLMKQIQDQDATTPPPTQPQPGQPDPAAQWAAAQAATATGAPLQQLPDNWQQYVTRDEKTGFYSPAHPSAGHIAALANQQAMQELQRANLLKQGPEKYFEQDPNARNWLQQQIQAGVQQQMQQHQQEQVAESFRQKHEHLLVHVDPNTGQALVDSRTNQKFPTPLGANFKKHYVALANAGLRDVSRLLDLAYKSAYEETARAGLLPATLQQPQAPPQQQQAPMPAWMQHQAGTMTPPAGPFADLARTNAGFGHAAPYGNFPARPLAAGNLSLEDSLRHDTAHLPDGLPADAYFDAWNASPRSPLALR